MQIVVNNISKTEQEWLTEFNAIGRKQFYVTYNVQNLRQLREIIEEAKGGGYLINATPNSQPAWRIKAILSQMGTKAQVDAAIEGLPEPSKTIAKLAWNEGATLERNSPLVGAIAQTIGYTEEQIDDIFNNAHNMNV